MVSKRILEDYQSKVDQNDSYDDMQNESDYINNNLQLIEKEIEPYTKDYFDIISRDLQQGNIKQGGMMYMITLESYHRSLTYTKGLKQKIPQTKTQEYEIVDPEFNIESVDWEDKEAVKNIPKIKVTCELRREPVIVTKVYDDLKNKKQVEKHIQLTEIDFLKPHILNSPLERSSHFIVLSNSVEGFLRKNRRTIAREVNAKTTDSIEAGKPIIMKNNSRGDYFNSGGAW